MTTTQVYLKVIWDTDSNKSQDFFLNPFVLFIPVFAIRFIIMIRIRLGLNHAVSGLIPAKGENRF